MSTEALAVVTWEDTTNVATWQDRDEVREFATDGGWVCQNVGWVVYEDDECVVLAARRADDKQGHVGLAERIPKRAIIERTVIRSSPNDSEPAEVELRLPDGCIGGHSPDLVNCELGADWP